MKMAFKITKPGRIALLVTMLSFIALTQSIGSARISGIDLDIQNIKYEHDADQMVHFSIFVKNKGTESTESVSFGFDFGTGMGMGFAGPIVIKPGETKVFSLGSSYSESGKFVVTANVYTDGDVNLKNNLETAIVNIK